MASNDNVRAEPFIEIFFGYIEFSFYACTSAFKQVEANP